MSDSINFKYRIEGSPRVLAKFVQTIKKVRFEYGDGKCADGLGFPVYDRMDGSLTWAGWAGSLVYDNDESLASLTRRNATRILAYHGESNDDYIRGQVLRMEKGEVREVGFWDADVGFPEAMASIKLEGVADMDSAMVLLKALERACDRPGRRSAVLAQMLLEAMLQHPSLARSPIWTRVMDLRSQLAASDITSDTANGDGDLDSNRIDWLFAKIEAARLMASLTATTGEACPPKVVRL